MNDVQAKSERRSTRTATAVRHQDLHDRLLDTAEYTIATEGLAHLRARTLAETVGCSVGAIYGVFADLDTLILAVNARTLDAMTEALHAAAAAAPGEAPQGAIDRLLQLAQAYLDYAVANRARWMALFQHRLPPGRPLTEAYAARQAVAFSQIEGPLADLRPDLTESARALLARTIFSAVHGMVQLGLDEKVAQMNLAVLAAQIRIVVQAMATGLQAAAG
jgi:AcrR family transcriptional regulator